MFSLITIFSKMIFASEKPDAEGPTGINESQPAAVTKPEAKDDLPKTDKPKKEEDAPEEEDSEVGDAAQESQPEDEAANQSADEPSVIEEQLSETESVVDEETGKKIKKKKVKGPNPSSKVDQSAIDN